VRILIAVALLACISCVTVESGNYPTLAVSTWQLYKNLDIGYALTLPRFWEVIDLDRQPDRAPVACAPDGQLRDSRRAQIESLHSRGVRLFACDTNRAADQEVPLAYTVRGQAPAEGLDKYLDSTAQVAGREVLVRRHAATNAGDMVIQHVHERLTLPDGSAHDLMQYQFLVLRFNALHLFFVEFPTALEDAIGKDADLMGTSFTPIR
jgi:hypothetical protein